jgi:hypothetical protein
VPLGGVPVQRSGEEHDQLLAQLWLEPVFGKLRRGLGRIEQTGLSHSVPPGRLLGAGHLVQRHRHRIALRREIVAGPLAVRVQKRIEITRGTRRNLLRVHIGQ